MEVMKLNRSKVLLKESNFNKRSSTIFNNIFSDIKSYEDIPKGTFDFNSIIKSGNIVLNFKDLDFDFNVHFDDDLEANQCDIVIYNLSDNTINNLKKGNEISIEAGYKKDTGIIFKGFIDQVKTGYEDVDKVTSIICYSCVGTERVENVTYAENTKASKILKDLILKLKMPIAVFNVRRDWTYESSVTIDGNLREEIKKYAEVCGISVYANNGSIYARYIKDGDNINFTVNENTGMIGSPEHYNEEIKAEDYIDTIDGYKIEMLLQHRVTTASIINLSSRVANGIFRVRKGEHIFNNGEAITKIEAIGSISSKKEEKEEKQETKKTKATNKDGKNIVAYAKKLIGTPYVWGGYSVKGFDCSGFVSYVMLNCGVKTKLKSRLNSTDIYNLSKKVLAPDIGDIAYFDNGETKHIGIITGNGKMIHCYSGKGVEITDISYGGNIVGYGRLTN